MSLPPQVRTHAQKLFLRHQKEQAGQMMPVKNGRTDLPAELPWNGQDANAGTTNIDALAQATAMANEAAPAMDAMPPMSAPMAASMEAAMGQGVAAALPPQQEAVPTPAPTAEDLGAMTAMMPGMGGQ